MKNALLYCTGGELGRAVLAILVAKYEKLIVVTPDSEWIMPQCSGSSTEIICANLASTESRGRVFDLLRQRESLDCLVSCVDGAGCTPQFNAQSPPLQNESLDQWVVGITGLWRAVIPAMLERNSGHALHLTAKLPASALEAASAAFMHSLVSQVRYECKDSQLSLDSLTVNELAEISVYFQNLTDRALVS